MSIEKKIYICEVSGNWYEEKELADASENVYPLVNLWKTSVRSRRLDKHCEVAGQLNAFFATVCESLGWKKDCFNFVGTPQNILGTIATTYFKGLESKESQMKAQGFCAIISHVADLSNDGPEFNTGLRISASAGVCLQDELHEYFSHTGKYTVAETTEELTKNE